MKTIYHTTITKLLKIICLLMIATLSVTGSYAQEPEDVNGGGTSLNDDTQQDTSVPIDGGLSILVAAGIGYGAKRLHDQRKKRGTESEVVI